MENFLYVGQNMNESGTSDSNFGVCGPGALKSLPNPIFFLHFPSLPLLPSSTVALPLKGIYMHTPINRYTLCQSFDAYRLETGAMMASSEILHDSHDNDNEREVWP